MSEVHKIVGKGEPGWHSKADCDGGYEEHLHQSDYDHRQFIIYAAHPGESDMSPPTPVVGIDAERLARALLAASHRDVYDPFDEKGEVPAINARYHANGIIAEYARLAEEVSGGQTDG